MSGEGGRRIDAIILGSGWEVGNKHTNPNPEKLLDPSQDPPWTVHQFHFHLITALLPHLIRQPPERNIRIISLVSPTYTTALPGMQGKALRLDSPAQMAGTIGIRTLFLMSHFQLILDTLASALHSSIKPVPKADDEGTPKIARRREDGLKSNIMALSVIMPWTRSEVIRGMMGVDTSWAWWIMYVKEED
jgi:hypothetical protein